MIWANRKILCACLFLLLFLISISAGEWSSRKKTINNDLDIIRRYPGRWRVLPIRSQSEFQRGKIGGEGEQHPHSIARSISNPDIIYFSHDVAGAWFSKNSGKSWTKTLDKGLLVKNGQSIEVDPQKSSRVFLIADNSSNWLAKGLSGLYCSQNYGEDWRLVLKTNVNFNRKLHRMYTHNIAFSQKVADNEQRIWYVAFAKNGLYRSLDGGMTWEQKPVADLSDYQIIYSVYTHPLQYRTVYIATGKGLLVSTQQGNSMKVVKSLQDRNISSIAVDPVSSRLYVTIKGDGLYCSKNNGSSFRLMKKSDAAYVFINTKYPQTLYLVNLRSNLLVTHNGGNSWIDTVTVHPEKGLQRDTGWKSKIAGVLSGIVPDPRDRNKAIVYSRGTVWETHDGGKNFYDSSTLFTGFAWGWWNSSASFDLFNRNRFILYNFDVGMTITHNNGKYFDLRNQQAWRWYKQKKVPWIGTYSGALQPVKGSKIIVATIGNYFSTKIMRSENEGVQWTLIQQEKTRQNLFVAFNLLKPNIVYAGSKISFNSGKSFQDIDFGSFDKYKPFIAGMCKQFPDTIYALDNIRQRIFRSDNCGQQWRLYANPGWSFRKLDSLPTFAVDPNNKDIIYTIDNEGDLVIFNGKKWRKTGVLKLAQGFRNGNFVRTIAIDPNYSNVLYAGMNASGITSVWRSLDNGVTWVNITENLPRIGVRSLTVNPHSGELYQGNVAGTWIYPAPKKYYQ